VPINLHTILHRANTKGIGPTGLKMLAAIAEGCAAGKPPTRDELCQRLGIGNNAANKHRIKLETLGLIDAEANLSRALRVTCRFVMIPCGPENCA
jgi:hypothetical protein